LRARIRSRRQVSIAEIFAATRGPAPSNPRWIQFFFLSKDLHNRKNWLFFGDVNAGQRGSIIYSIIESCRRHGIEPYTYLQDVLTRLPSITNRQIKDIVPKTWAAATRKIRLRAA
jgi:hypothetical protein